MRRNTFCIIIFIFVLPISFTDTVRARPDSHAPIGVMGEHGHKTGEMMLAYRFIAMDMRGLQSGTDAVETADVLKDFMMAPTAMDMKVHLFGVMFAPPRSHSWRWRVINNATWRWRVHISMQQDTTIIP